MSRKKGTPNKPKSEAEKELKKAVIKQLETNGWITEKNGSKNKPKFEIIGADVKKGMTVNDSVELLKEYAGNYRVCHAQILPDLIVLVEANIELGYQCQGGVSVTNYRGLDGKIVMVYAQAMVKRDS